MRESRAIQAERLKTRRDEENRRRTKMSLSAAQGRLRRLSDALGAKTRKATSIDDRDQRLMVWIEAALGSETHWQFLKYLEQVERLIRSEPAKRDEHEGDIGIDHLSGRVAGMLEPEDEDEEDREAVAG